MKGISSPPPAILKPSGYLYRENVQSNLVTGTWELVHIDAIRTGFTDGIEDTVLNKITPGVAGLYLVLGQVTFLNFVADKSYAARVQLNGAVNLCWDYKQASVASDYLTVPISGPYWFTNTDYIKLEALSLAGVDTVDIKEGPHFTFLSVHLLRKT